MKLLTDYIYYIILLTGILATSRETRGKQLDYLSERWFIQDLRGEFCKANH